MTLPSGPLAHNLRLDTACLTAQLNQQNIRIDRFLASGGYGSVYIACIKDNCEYVVKVTFMTKDPLSDYEKEWKAQVLAASYNVAPRVIAHWICSTNNYNKDGKEGAVGYILMDKYDTTMKEFTERGGIIPAAVIDEFKKAYWNLNQKEGLYHVDSHVNNIFVKLNASGTAVKLVLGDWANAKHIKISPQRLKLWLTAPKYGSTWNSDPYEVWDEDIYG